MHSSICTQWELFTGIWTNNKSLIEIIRNTFLNMYLFVLFFLSRDLKPENILLSEDMHIHITDFGTAKQLSSDSTQSNTQF